MTWTTVLVIASLLAPTWTAAAQDTFEPETDGDRLAEAIDSAATWPITVPSWFMRLVTETVPHRVVVAPPATSSTRGATADLELPFR